MVSVLPSDFAAASSSGTSHGRGAWAEPGVAFVTKSAATRQLAILAIIIRSVASCWPRQFGGMERLERVDRFDRLRVAVPFERPKHHLVGREVHKRKAVLLDRLDLLAEIEHGGRQRGRATNADRRPADRACSNRSRQRDVDRVTREVETPAAQHLAEC